MCGDFFFLYTEFKYILLLSKMLLSYLVIFCEKLHKSRNSSSFFMLKRQSLLSKNIVLMEKCVFLAFEVRNDVTPNLT